METCRGAEVWRSLWHSFLPKRSLIPTRSRRSPRAPVRLNIKESQARASPQRILSPHTLSLFIARSHRRLPTHILRPPKLPAQSPVPPAFARSNMDIDDFGPKEPTCRMLEVRPVSLSAPLG